VELLDDTAESTQLVKQVKEDKPLHPFFTAKRKSAPMPSEKKSDTVDSTAKVEVSAMKIKPQMTANELARAICGDQGNKPVHDFFKPRSVAVKQQMQATVASPRKKFVLLVEPEWPCAENVHVGQCDPIPERNETTWQFRSMSNVEVDMSQSFAYIHEADDSISDLIAQTYSTSLDDVRRRFLAHFPDAEALLGRPAFLALLNSTESNRGSSWIDQYKSIPSEQICLDDKGEATFERLRNWLRTFQPKSLAGSPCRSKGDSDDDTDTSSGGDYIDDSDDDFVPSGACQRKKKMAKRKTPCCFIHNASYSLTTLMVHALAREHDFEIFEIHTGTKRSGPELMDSISECTTSHLFHKKQSSKKSLIFLQDVDIVYVQDAGFLRAIAKVIEQTKRPIIVTFNGTTPQRIPILHLR
jgi:hypothetical protein